MYLIIAHFTRNKWTTDYLLDYLRKNKKSYYFLRHPFWFEKDLKYSELIYFNWNNEKIIWKYKKCDNETLDLLRNFILNFYIWFKLIWKYKKIIGFWSFNVVPNLFFRLFWKEIYFYWVDYSTKRFWNKILNWIYKVFETLSCKFSNKVFSSSERQKQARIKFHWLSKNKAIVINNWINFENFKKDFSKYKELWFFYLGSITKQHWIIQFIKYFYIKNKINIPLFIIWWWEEENNLIKIIKENNLKNLITFYWRKDKEEIKSILTNIDKKIFWIAPYDDKDNDHVYYGDALKIKEFLIYNIPYIVSSILDIQNDLKEFWIVYNNFDELLKILNSWNLENFSLDVKQKNKVLENYSWNSLFSKYF